MIAFLRGELVQISGHYLILDVQGVGYQIYAHPRLQQALHTQRHHEVKVLTHLLHKEDAQELYGFLDLHEKEVFMHLIKVSGVGPKSALGIIASMPANEIVKAIVNNQAHILKQAPGIGLKTAQRIILELREKLSKLRPSLATEMSIPLEQHIIEELEMTLLALGYSEQEIQLSLEKIGEQLDQTQTTEEVLPHVLTLLSGEIP